jgi:ubiquinone/menaquinone biosynthesis C-methylase UbiE
VQLSYECIDFQGCGNGKYMTLKANLFTLGCDRSRQLCELAKEKDVHIPIIIADNLQLPYRDNLFDAVLSIGVIHHLATHQRRLQAIKGS